MTISLISEAFEKKTESQRMKDNTGNKKGKTDKVLIYERNVHRKYQSCILIRGEEIRFMRKKPGWAYKKPI